MSKLFNAAAIVSLATLLASGGFVGYLFGTGRLSTSRLSAIARVLRGDKDDQGAKASEPPTGTTQPAEAPRGHTSEEAQALRKHEYLERLRVERALSDLEAQRRLLDQVMQHVVSEQERLSEDKTTFETQRKQVSDTAHDEGFRKELDYVGGLAPRQAKEHIVRVWRKQKADAVRLFMALDVSKGKRILEQLKTPEELQIQTDLLEQVRVQGMEGYADPSGKTAGAAAP